MPSRNMNITRTYLRDEEFNRRCKWITVGNLKKILAGFPDDLGVEASDLSDLLITNNKDYLGLLELKDGEGHYRVWKCED